MQATPSILSPHHKILDFLNRFSDVALLGISLVITIEFFFAKEWGQTATVLFLFAIIYHQLSASLCGLYDSQRSLKVSTQVYQVLSALAGTFALVTMTTALSNRLHALADRDILFVWFMLSSVTLCIWRIILRKLLSSFRQKGINVRHAVIAGSGQLGKSLATRFANNPWMGVEVLSFYD